jgi:hypothetical protein
MEMSENTTQIRLENNAADIDLNSTTQSVGDKFIHQDPLLNATLYFDACAHLWLVEYYRERTLTSTALYQSESTAILMLSSHGYHAQKRKVG